MEMTKLRPAVGRKTNCHAVALQHPRLCPLSVDVNRATAVRNNRPHGRGRSRGLLRERAQIFTNLVANPTECGQPLFVRALNRCRVFKTMVNAMRLAGIDRTSLVCVSQTVNT